MLVETGEEIAAEFPLLHVLVQVPVGGARHADVDLLGRGGAQREDLLGLQHAQELGLGIQGHVADLIEEEGAMVGQLDEARLVTIGAGEGAASVPEELALEEVLRDGRAVDGLEAPLAPREAVERAGHDLLAGARLAEHHAGELGGGDALDVGGDGVDEVAADELRRLLGQASAAHRAVDAIRHVAGGVLGHELEDRVADADLVTVLEDAVVDVTPVDQRPVAAAQIRDAKGRAEVSGPEDARVLAAHGLLGDADRARGVASEDHLARVKRVRGGELLEVRGVEQDEPRERRLRRREDGSVVLVAGRDAGAEPIHHDRGG